VARLIGRVLANSAALLATGIVPGIAFTGGPLALLACGALFGLFNLLVRPVAVLLALPFLILTLGLFGVVLNGLLLWLAAALLPGYSVSGPLSGVLGALVIAAVNWAIEALGPRPERTGKTSA